MSAPLGMLQWSEGTRGEALVENALRFEALGYRELWLPELAGREPFSTAGYLLARTRGLRVSSGIANVYARDADAAAQAANGLAELSGGRFSLGLGVSHPLLVEPRGQTWQKPVPKMRDFLHRLHRARIESPRAEQPAPVLVAAHGPGLLEVARKQADGVFLFLQPVEAIRRARERLGPDKAIHAVVRCALAEDAERARDLARRACAFYTALPAYHRAWRRLGYEEGDWAQGVSDRLIDAICAWGDAATLKTKLAAYEEAGATQVVVYPCNPDEDYAPDSAVSRGWNWELLEALAEEWRRVDRA